ncbi:MAG TPA: hypothetical protein VMJ10_31165 [Kofleriaceae bacterium]|nr:hypothetical protein [Kofleriaceae bacterium]
MKRAILVVLALAFAGSTAFAQVAPAIEAPRPPIPREGIFGGFGAWGGNISCNGSDCGGFSAAGGGSGHLGYMFNRQLGILIDVWALTSKSGNVGLTFLTSTVDVRFWVLPILWVQGGLGNGHAIVHVDGFAAASGDVPVGEVGAGVEVLRGRNWDLDVVFQVAQGTSTNDSGGSSTGRSTGLGVQLTWY